MPRTPTGAARVASSLPWPALLRAALALLLVGLLLWTVDWRGSLARLRDAAPPLVLAALALVAACVLVSAWKWQLLLRARGLHAGLPALVRLYWIGIFCNNLMPSTFGGDAVRLALARHLGGAAAVGASILVERASGFLVLVLLALAALLLGPSLAELWGLGLAAASVAAVGGLSLALLLRRGRALVRLAAATAPGSGRLPGRLLRKLDALVLALGEYGGDGRALLVTCAVSVLFNGLLVLSHYVVIRATDGGLALWQVALVTPLVTLVSALPVSINGIGLAEGAFVALYARVGLAPEAALAAALLRRVVVLLASLVGALLWLGERPLPGR
jgi:uncharacterized protein (TIRG00374 family)